MRAIVIGDVHGCLAELEELLVKVGLAPADRLYFLGDLVDRGPHSLGVVDRVRGLLEAHPGSACIAGNHEEKWLRMRDKDRPLRDWATHATPEQWAFLDALPLYVRVPEHSVVLVHGGFTPRFFDKHGALPESMPDWRRSKEPICDRARRFLRVRVVDDKGEMVALDHIEPHHPHWSAGYDGREGFCFFGHDPQLAPAVPLRAKHAMGIDTGCCFGGTLTAAILTDGVAPEQAEIVSVLSHGQYAQPRLGR